MTIKEIKEGLFAPRTEEIEVVHNDKSYKFIISELSYLSQQNMALKAAQGKNTLALMISEAVKDESGEKFDYDTALALPKEIADPLVDAWIKLTKKEEKEKN